MRKRNTIEYKVYGKYALFTDPVTKTGGEKFSYQIPTYQALKGITESIYWKPTFIWYIDEVRIMHQIEMQSKGIRPIHYQDDKNDLSIYTYLHNVEYQVRAHFEWNNFRPDLAGDRNENKHWDIAKRMVERGGRRDVFLGTRECQGYVENCAFGEGDGFYDEIDLSFGIMVHGITYPDEEKNKGKKGNMTIRLWTPLMRKGVIQFVRPEECSVLRGVGERYIRDFQPGINFSGADEFSEEEGE
ncbi:MAG: type I-C CRISPR-associated protein Cas5c [Lachnospiraceae bacterium]|nr:type I-C CRISPR-associated protein Cas5c [Lachnospiraceae bacterium]